MSQQTEPQDTTDRKASLYPASTCTTETPQHHGRRENEHQIRQQRQTTAKAALTKKKNQVTVLMNNSENLHLVKTGLEEIEQLMSTCELRHGELVAFLLRESMSTDLEDTKFEDTALLISGFNAKVKEWIKAKEDQLQDDMDSGSNYANSYKSKRSCSIKSRHIYQSSDTYGLTTKQLKSSMRASSVRSSSSISQKSNRSNLNFACTMEKATVAELTTQKAFIEKQATLSLEIAQLQVKENLMNVEAKIQMAKAREEVLEEAVVASGSELQDIQPAGIQQVHDILSDDDKQQIQDIPLTSPQHQLQDLKSGSVKHHSSGIRGSHSSGIQNQAPGVAQSIQSADAQLEVHELQPDQSSDTQVQQQQLKSNPVLRSNDLDIMYQSHRQLAASMLLPPAEVPRFNGDPLEFSAFMMAFKARIVPYTNSDSDKLYYLNQHLEGEPKNLIAGCLFMEPRSGFDTAMEQLQKQYGDPYIVSSAYINAVLNWSYISSDDSKGLYNLALFLSKCNHAMKAMSNMLILNYTQNLQIVVTKLPEYLKKAWQNQAESMSKRQEDVTFSTLVDFIQHAANAANNPIFGTEALAKVDQQMHSPPSNKPKTTCAVTRTTESKRNSDPNMSPCQLCRQMHHLDDCPQFGKMSIDERVEFLKENQMCFGCLGNDHTSKGCLKRRKCTSCGGRHPTSLHRKDFKLSENRQENNTNEKYDGSNDLVHARACTLDNTVLQPVLPVQVRIKGSNKTINTYAFYDNGSTGCFVTESIKDQLGAKDVETIIKLQTMHGTDFIHSSVVTNLVVSDILGNNDTELPKAFTCTEIPVSREQIPSHEILQQWPHLKYITDKIPPSNASTEIGLLIGSSCPDAIQPLQVIPSSGNGPFAVRYKHGWTINGPLYVGADSQGVTSNIVIAKESSHATDCITTDSIAKYFKVSPEAQDVESNVENVVPKVLNISREKSSG